MVHCHRRHSSSTLSHLNRERESNTYIWLNNHVKTIHLMSTKYAITIKHLFAFLSISSDRMAKTEARSFEVLPTSDGIRRPTLASFQTRVWRMSSWLVPLTAQTSILLKERKFTVECRACVGPLIIIIIIYVTSIALKSSVARAQKRNKTKSLIIFKSRGHAGIIISLRGCRLFKVEKQF